MSTIVDYIATFRGEYQGTYTGYDIPYIVAAVCLVLGVWFVFKVILILIHGLMGGK